jgi:hypothetical protein
MRRSVTTSSESYLMSVRNARLSVIAMYASGVIEHIVGTKRLHRNTSGRVVSVLENISQDEKTYSPSVRKQSIVQSLGSWGTRPV